MAGVQYSRRCPAPGCAALGLGNATRTTPHDENDARFRELYRRCGNRYVDPPGSDQWMRLVMTETGESASRHAEQALLEDLTAQLAALQPAERDELGRSLDLQLQTFVELETRTPRPGVERPLSSAKRAVLKNPCPQGMSQWCSILLNPVPRSARLQPKFLIIHGNRGSS